MKFRRLKLIGFKSFVEPTELLIEPGLTGIVGPNGCGKSNLLEALRWVMGENSYKSMRAAAMEDVIFSGSRTRPPRNHAEVVLTLDNSARRAPPPWQEADTLEVSRRLVREKGSVYRINGRDVRARDVQLLFADASTGARSPALVRQGRISEIINAKPQARRRILEEAAGITGLHTRRHEAELKLNAAETNLERLQDIITQLEAQVSALRRQARQAGRYRELSAEIQRLEATTLWLAWRQAQEAVAAERTALEATVRQLAEHVRAATELARRRETLAEEIAPLREAEVTRGTVLQRLTVEREALERSEAAIAARRRELEERIEQTHRDLAAAHEELEDAAQALARLDEEAAALKADNDGVAARETAEEALAEAEAAMHAAQERVDALQRDHAERDARRAALSRGLTELERRLDALREELDRLEARRRSLTDRLADDGEAAAAAAGLTAAEAALARAVDKAKEWQESQRRAEAALATAEETLATARRAEDEARDGWNEARRRAEGLLTEVRTLEKLLGGADADLFPPLVDAVRVAPGLERALAAALGDELEAPLDEAAPAHWRSLPAFAPREIASLPAGVRALADFVEAPPVLARRIAHVGLVEDEAQGHALQGRLRPGQRLVSRDGDLWRWDGFVAAAEAPTAAARRLAERNRLEDLRAAAAQAAEAADAAQRVFDEARERREAAQAAVEAARDALVTVRHEAAAARDALEAARAARTEAAAVVERVATERASIDRELRGLEDTLRRRRTELAEVEAARAEARAELAARADDEDLEAALAEARAVLEERRRAHAEARARRDSLLREAEMRERRLAAIASERADWEKRRGKTQDRITDLEQRLKDLRAALDASRRAPAELEDKRARLSAAIAEAEAARRDAADRLAAAESTLREVEAAWRAAEQAVTEAREDQARLQARLEGSGARLREAMAEIARRMDCEPAHLPARAGIDTDAPPDIEAVADRLQALREARDRLGAVNLRAEAELAEATAELDRLVNEREDLLKAIEKLRGGIASLNREGRRRLLEAFDRVNENFAALFVTLFGGGQAHLELVEDDDPLQAGLEIFARPPGKRTQTLSLLSGGEQTLTAIALIFAVFLTNPSPICVLDEVDAPLDEHNVERFCNLLDDMLKRADTDFLVITHHPLTMARMHRLFGVTMTEPGVSRLVSVDLQTAETLREAS